MIVFRLETADNVGIYTSGIVNDACCEMGDYDLAYNLNGPHPMPHADSLLVENGYNELTNFYLFCFSSYEQYRAWFFNDKFLEHLAALDVYLVLYDTEDFIIGNTQCVFDPNTAVSIGRFHPLTPKEVLPL